MGGKNISELVDLPITELKEFFDHLELDEHDSNVSRRIQVEINSRIRFLIDVGLGYLTLNRLSNSLSGGESQRINLATSLGSSLVGSLYILDEPSIGLHSRDTDRLLHVLRQLQQLGNTVVVVEHDEEIIRAADYIIDIGPNAGRLVGEVILTCAFQFYIIIPRPTMLRNGNFIFSQKITYRVAVASFLQILHIALVNNLSPQTSCIRTYINNVICSTDDLFVVLYHYYRIA